jgi:guanine nucleotide-binding protein G(i) subunit alpha
VRFNISRSQTWTQQESYIRLEESRSVLELAKGCSSSIFGLDDTISSISETTANISVVFDFDTLILGSRIYQHAERSHLREAIRAKKSRKDTSVETAIVEDDVETTSLIRDEISNRTADGRTKGDFDDQHGNRGSITTHRRATKTMAAVSLSNPVPSIEPSRQPNTFDSLDWWRKSSRHKVIPEHKVHPDSTSRQKLSAPKVLILGASESGKSTLLKALQSCLKQHHYTVEERLSYCELIRSNVIHGARVVLEAMERLELPMDIDTNDYHRRTIFMPPSDETAHAVRSLWLDAGFQDAIRRGQEHQLPDNFQYYATDVGRLMSSDYVPTDEDILRSSVMTTGITESSLSYYTFEYRFIDVGGKRSERKKWIHVFDDVRIVLFTIDAHNYAKVLREDEKVNQMQEQLDLFDSIVNSWWFEKSSFIIVFTKIDMLEERLLKSPVENYFPDYSPGNSSFGFVEHYMEYLEKRFMSLVSSATVLKRTRIIRTNLVDASRRPGQELWENLGELG